MKSNEIKTAGNLHICKYLLIRCKDFRLHDELEIWIRESELSKQRYDLLSSAGASKRLVDGNAGKRSDFLEDIGHSVSSHQVETIIIFHHSDCGAYALDHRFNSPQEEKEKQLEDMKKARGIILEKHSGVNVILLWGELQDEEGKEITFEIISN